MNRETEKHKESFCVGEKEFDQNKSYETDESTLSPRNSI
jgi:hypothetical protein